MAKRFFTVFFVSILSLGYLSVGLLPAGERRLASCADPVAEANTLALPSGLFGEIKDEALKKSTLDYYLFLTKVEMQALAGRQSIRQMYGLADSAPVSVLPTITPFDPRANAFATGSLWGSLVGEGQMPNSFTVGKSLPNISIPPYTSGYVAEIPAKRVEGTLFPPYSQQAVNQKVTYSPTVGTFLPSANRTNHKIGTF